MLAQSNEKPDLVKHGKRIWSSLPHCEVSEVLVLDVADEAFRVADESQENSQATNGPTNFSELCHSDVMTWPEDLFI